MACARLKLAAMPLWRDCVCSSQPAHECMEPVSLCGSMNTPACACRVLWEDVPKGGWRSYFCVHRSGVPVGTLPYPTLPVHALSQFCKLEASLLMLQCGQRHGGRLALVLFVLLAVLGLLLLGLLLLGVLLGLLLAGAVLGQDGKRLLHAAHARRCTRRDKNLRSDFALLMRRLHKPDYLSLLDCNMPL